MEHTTLLLKYVPTEPLKVLGEVKTVVAPDTASTALSAAVEPMVQRRMMAKLELAAGLVTMFRSSGRICSAAARSRAKVRV